MKIIIRGVSKNAKTSVIEDISKALVAANPALAAGTLIIWSPDECVLATSLSEAKSYLEIHGNTEGVVEFLKETLYPLGYDMQPHIMLRYIKAEERVPLSLEAIEKCTPRGSHRLIDRNGYSWLIRHLDHDDIDSDVGPHTTLFLESTDRSNGAPTSIKMRIVAGSALGFDDVEHILINDDNSLSSKFMDLDTHTMKGAVVYRR